MRRFDDQEPCADPLWNRGTAIDLPGERVPYQAALRALGAFLDERGASSINLLEAESGFAVRYQAHSGSPDTTLVRLDGEELLSLSSELERRRRRGRGFFFGGGKEQPEENRTYENILRALGYELDQVQAYSILVDEIDDGMVVTYQYLNPREGFNARKRMVILGGEAMRNVLEDAQSRREQRKHGILTLLAS
jgi:hypothetical protein